MTFRAAIAVLLCALLGAAPGAAGAQVVAAAAGARGVVTPGGVAGAISPVRGGFGSLDGRPASPPVPGVLSFGFPSPSPVIGARPAPGTGAAALSLPVGAPIAPVLRIRASAAVAPASVRVKGRPAAASLGGLAVAVTKGGASARPPALDGFYAGNALSRGSGPGIVSGAGRRVGPLAQLARRVKKTFLKGRDARAAPPGPIAGLVRENESFLDEIQRRAFLFFWENTDPDSGLTRDRADNFGGKETREVASIAATGFGLVALGIAHSRGWITYEAAYGRALAALKGFRSRQGAARGWSYHFLNLRSGARVGNSEVSSIDTALFLVGSVFAGRYFKGTEVERLAEEVYRRVDFPWMMTDGGRRPGEKTLAMGWTPEGGFLKDRWHEYSEHMILSILGMGSPGSRLPSEVWRAFSRMRGSYAGFESIASGPLFTHQYSHMAIDFRGLYDGLADYFQNSVAATLANRRFAMDRMGQYRTYGPDSWGLTASDGPDGYRAYGAPPGREEHDGTVAPSAAGGSIVFTPELSIRALRFFLSAYGDRIWGRYGFADSFNTDPRWKNRFNAPGLWRSPDVIGIDQGVMLLMIENLRTGLVWKTLMASPHIRRGLRAANFVRGPGPRTK